MTTPPFTWHLLPAELRARPQWVTWRLEKRDGKPTKVPYNPHTGKRARSNEPSTWGTHSECMTALERDKKYDGIGFMTSEADPYTLIDLDKCVDDQGNLTPEAQEFVALINSYTEESPSRRGRRMIARGALPPRGRKKGNVEMYCTTRFVTLTGWHIEGTPTTIEDRQEQILAMHRRVWGDVTSNNGSHPQRESEPPSADDQTLIEKVRKEKKYDDLWCGRWESYYPSQSEADLALCDRISHFFGPDKSKIDDVFRRSSLKRKKWDRQDYREETIAKALAGKTEFYSDWLKAHQNSSNGSNGSHAEEPPHPADAVQVREPAGTGDRLTLVDVMQTFRRWLHLPDDGHIIVVIADYVANMMPGDPVWLMLISPPSSGKTEAIVALSGRPKTRMASSINGEASLLSGTAKRDQAKGATGGILRQIGEQGVLLLKDFTSILSMKHETRLLLLAALREIHDGQWTRDLGVEGGKTLEWKGKLGVIAGCTDLIDNHHALIAAMGERFIFYRLPRMTEKDARLQARKALTHRGREEEMRRELSEAVAGLLASLDFKAEPVPLTEEEEERLLDLAVLGSRCRSAVERDGYKREIVQIPGPEAPARLAGSLQRLLFGMRAIGTPDEVCWQLLVRVSLDSMPALRWAALQFAADQTVAATTAEFAVALAHPTSTVRRALEDLTAHGLLHRTKDKGDRWPISDWARELFDHLKPYIRGYAGTSTRKIPPTGMQPPPGDAPGPPPPPHEVPDTVCREFSGTDGCAGTEMAVSEVEL